MGISIYFLRKFGISYRLAKSLDEDGVELLDLFLQYNPIISEKYLKSKINKLNNFLFDAIQNLQTYSNIYDEIFMLESLGSALGTNRIYKFSNSISEYQHLLKSIDWKGLNINKFSFASSCAACTLAMASRSCCKLSSTSFTNFC